jgi:hypothetical protein
MKPLLLSFSKVLRDSIMGILTCFGVGLTLCMIIIRVCPMITPLSVCNSSWLRAFSPLLIEQVCFYVCFHQLIGIEWCSISRPYGILPSSYLSFFYALPFLSPSNLRSYVESRLQQENWNLRPWDSRYLLCC